MATRKEVLDAERAMVSSRLSDDGRFEFPSSVPTEAPIGYRVPRSTVELMRDMIRREVSEAAAAAEMETWEEADDFEVEDDPLEPRTEYERLFDFPATDIGEPLNDDAAGGSSEPGGGRAAGDSGPATSKPPMPGNAPGGSGGSPSVPPAAG